MRRLTRIETARLWLRPYRQDDLDVLHTFFTDPGVRRYLLDDEIVPREWVADEIHASTANFEQQGFGQWAIFPRDGEDLIGFTGYRFFHDPPELQLLYGIAPSHWGRGLATEAARAMIRCGFEEHGFDAIVASTDVPNTASVRVMEKAGLRFAKRIEIDGLDTIYYQLERGSFAPDDSPYTVVAE
ncbi:MAG: GNAT family N-acetyltransferase [Acidobacteriota bacterium]